MRKFKLTLGNGTKLHIHPPTVRQYYDKYLSAGNDEDVYRTIAEMVSRNDEGITFTRDDVIDKFTVDDFSGFIEDFPDWIVNEKDSDPN